MEAMRSTWTDQRLDDLNTRVGKMSDWIDHQSDRIDALQHTIITVGGSPIAAMLAVLAG